MKPLKLLTLLILLSSSVATLGQNISPIALSNYGTAQSLFISPSLNGYSAYNWHVNLAGAWVNANNNFVGLKTPYSLYRVPNRIPEQYQTENGNAAFDREWLYARINGNRKHVSLAAAIYGPSASVKIGNARIGVFTQGYAGARITGVSENLAYAAFQEFDSARNAFRFFDETNSNGNNDIAKITAAAHTAANIGINANYSFPLKFDRKLIAGASVKRVFGFQGFHYTNDPFIFNSNFVDSVFIEPTSIAISSFGEGETGKGWGYDIGATYVFHKKEFKRNGPYQVNNTRYFTKTSLAIMDIGNIKYDDAFTAVLNLNRSFAANTDSFNLDINANNYQRVLDSLVSLYGSYSESRGNMSIGLPTRLVLSVDRQVKKHLFVSATLTQSLRKRHSRNMRYQNTLMLAPRWEWAYFEVSTPLLLAYDYRAIRLGTSIRFGPLYLGSNSVLPFIYTRNLRDADLFIGIAFGNMANYGLAKWAEENVARKKAKKKAKACVTF